MCNSENFMLFCTSKFAHHKIVMKNKFFPILLFILLGISCNHRIFYQKIDSLPHETWNVDSILKYEVSISDSLQYYNFYINIRNTTDYPYQDFHIFFTTQFPDGTVFTDTLHSVLCDAHGRWRGVGSGRIKENRFVFKSKVRFPQTGTYIFSAQQAMREDDIEGIINFGITLQYE